MQLTMPRRRQWRFVQVARHGKVQRLVFFIRTTSPTVCLYASSSNDDMRIAMPVSGETVMEPWVASAQDELGAVKGPSGGFEADGCGELRRHRVERPSRMRNRDVNGENAMRVGRLGAGRSAQGARRS
ncbi:hypothetical protein EJ04DRAFT_90815 [Polyplosphaeria fusca]|uniref:Uncharacterized protein n=1 Tax=Polyplosphaeria fusca TaxID=682080 RepID=A0A9P4QPE6_9PLEO|nr:hypothetical protein EJ04DRAFT_90815 [Polyplosphaeria fusca]